ncbi:hypothetical protein [Mangrovihabitans endophyticus]|uniref:Uncharacterized protein n=1 Tax=Mangrovihabitans endophyticus TaxID=1751298 RepID=A0A8J3C151_9ACTN|nr:hypothetical protein [Mangrovihabitans endophyticus]GGK95864.1 hypothetical protein GCM10012284_32530 [Mangrovihabitans endophyticus]
MIDFNVVVPEGWANIPTTPEFARVRKRIIDDIVRHHLPDSLPRDKAGPWRRILRKELTEATDEAARNGARAVLLPLREFNGVRLPGSMVMSVLEGGDDNVTTETVLGSILADAGENGTSLEIAGAPAARVAAVVDSAALRRTSPSLRVSYYVAHPEVSGVWGLLTFTVLSDGDVEADAVQAVVLVFDAIVGTLRWGNRDDIPTEDEVLAHMSPVGAEPPTTETRA